MIVECKALDVKLDEEVLLQVLRYNISVPVKYLAITNGKRCKIWENVDGTLISMKEIPEYGISDL